MTTVKSMRRTVRRVRRLVREPHRVVPAVRRRLWAPMTALVDIVADAPVEIVPEVPVDDLPEAPVEIVPVDPPVPTARRMGRGERLAVLTAHLDMGGSGLEIGPSHNPLLLKSEGHDIRIADHLDKAGLIAKYTGMRPTGRIEDVDYVLTSGRLTDSIPDHFDYILASHVAEHTVCLVSFLQDCQTLLSPGGRLSLALPDKRFCFDRLRERTSLGRVLDTYRAAPAVHTYGSVIEHHLNMVTKDGAVGWFDGAPGDFTLHVPLELVLQRAAIAEAGEYIDTHNWVLTPNHFRLLVHDVHLLGLITLRECAFTDTIDQEFFITLAVDGPGPGLSRPELAALSAAEQASSDAVHFAP